MNHVQACLDALESVDLIMGYERRELLCLWHGDEGQKVVTWRVTLWVHGVGRCTREVDFPEDLSLLVEESVKLKKLTDGETRENIGRALDKIGQIWQAQQERPEKGFCPFGCSDRPIAYLAVNRGFIRSTAP